MVCDIASTLKGACNTTFSSPFLNSIFGNVFKFSLLIVGVVMLIIMLLYPCKYGASTLLLFKIFAYIYISVFILNMYHNGVLRYNYEKQIGASETNEMLEKISGENRNLIPSDNAVPVAPKTDF